MYIILKILVKYYYDVIQENTIQCQLCQDMYSESKIESHLLAVHGVLEYN